jgi:hypothetical protein
MITSILFLVLIWIKLGWAWALGYLVTSIVDWLIVIGLMVARKFMSR